MLFFSKTGAGTELAYMLASNNPGKIDDTVFRRINTFIRLELPNATSRIKIFDLYLCKRAKKANLDFELYEEGYNNIVTELEGIYDS